MISWLSVVVYILGVLQCTNIKDNLVSQTQNLSDWGLRRGLPRLGFQCIYIYRLDCRLRCKERWAYHCSSSPALTWFTSASSSCGQMASFFIWTPSSVDFINTDTQTKLKMRLGSDRRGWGLPTVFFSQNSQDGSSSRLPPVLPRSSTWPLLFTLTAVLIR